MGGDHDVAVEGYCEARRLPPYAVPNYMRAFDEIGGVGGGEGDAFKGEPACFFCIYLVLIEC
jgi:hypothetical protein